jgi:hypothetical protein
MGRAGFSLFAALSIVAMIVIFVLGVQPPNQLALNVSIGFLLLSALIWFGFERRRFRGPPVGAMIVQRQAQIAAAEASLGQASPELSPPASGHP